MKKKTGQPELVILQKLELFFIVVMKKKIVEFIYTYKYNKIKKVHRISFINLLSYSPARTSNHFQNCS